MLIVVAWSGPHSQHEQQPGNVVRMHSLSVVHVVDAGGGAGAAFALALEVALADTTGPEEAAAATGALGAASFLHAAKARSVAESADSRIARSIREIRFRL